MQNKILKIARQGQNRKHERALFLKYRCIKKVLKRKKHDCGRKTNNVHVCYQRPYVNVQADNHSRAQMIS